MIVGKTVIPKEDATYKMLLKSLAMKPFGDIFSLGAQGKR
jgi:hypothetical protein